MLYCTVDVEKVLYIWLIVPFDRLSRPSTYRPFFLEFLGVLHHTLVVLLLMGVKVVMAVEIDL